MIFVVVLKRKVLHVSLFMTVFTTYFFVKASVKIEIWLVPVSLGQPCFVLVWSGPITSQEKCIQKWISAGLIIIDGMDPKVKNKF